MWSVINFNIYYCNSVPSQEYPVPFFHIQFLQCNINLSFARRFHNWYIFIIHVVQAEGHDIFLQVYSMFICDDYH
jgi:hypothetical protein